MKKTLVYILSFMPSFVKNEIEGLRQKGIDVRVIRLGSTGESLATQWSSITGKLDEELYLEDTIPKILKILHLMQNLYKFILRMKIHGILNLFKALKYNFHRRLYGVYILRYSLAIINALSGISPYRIHTHFAWGNANLAANVALLLDVAFSITVHADDIFGLNQKEEKNLKQIFAACDKVITISEYNKKFLTRRNLCQREKIYVIHCGIPLKKFNYSLHCNFKKTKKLHLTTLPSGFVEKKGFRILIEAIKVLKEKKIDVVCFVIGRKEKGILNKEYETIINNNNLYSSVKFVGMIPQNRLAEFYRSCDAFVLPCVRDQKNKIDGIPVSLMEAMALGLPVISTRISGIPELIDHEKSGLLAAPGDVIDLSEQIIKLFYNPNKIATMSIAARSKIETEFEIEKTTNELIASLNLGILHDI